MKSPLSLRRRLARWWPATTTRALAVCGIFGALLLATAYAAREYTALFGSSEGSGNVSGNEKGSRFVSFAELPPDDPVVRFADTGMGQVLFSTPGDDHCKRMLFDNRLGINYEAKDVACGPRPAPVVAQPEPPERLHAVRKSFQR